MLAFLFYQSHLKTGAVNQTIHSCFCKRLSIGQLNVQAETAEKEEQYTLSNIVYITFQNFFLFL